MYPEEDAVPSEAVMLIAQIVVSLPAFDTGIGFTVIFMVSFEEHPIRVVVRI